MEFREEGKSIRGKFMRQAIRKRWNGNDGVHFGGVEPLFGMYIHFPLLSTFGYPWPISYGNLSALASHPGLPLSFYGTRDL